MGAPVAPRTLAVGSSHGRRGEGVRRFVLYSHRLDGAPTATPSPLFFSVPRGGDFMLLVLAVSNSPPPPLTTAINHRHYHYCHHGAVDARAPGRERAPPRPRQR